MTRVTRTLAQVLVLGAALTVGLESRSVPTIIWGNCPSSDDTEICPDEYDLTVCGADINEPVNECSCDNHGYTWNGESCDEG